MTQEEQILKVEERINFLLEYIKALNEEPTLENRNKAFHFEQEYASRKMYLDTIRRDAALKQMELGLPELVKNIESSKLSKDNQKSYNSLKKRVQYNKYPNAMEKAKDFELAQQLYNEQA